MFACVLLRCGDKQEDATPLLAERASVNVRVVSTVGRGTALLDYVVDEDRELVLCIPSFISNKNGCSQEVKVTGCHFDIEDEGRTTLQIAKQDNYYSEKAKNIPTFTAVRKGLTNSISPNDTMIYLGRFKPKSGLSIQVEFVLRMPLKNTPCHTLDNSLLSKKLVYFLSYASHAKIKDVVHTGSVFQQFEWKFKDSSRQMITVQYATVNDFHEADELPSVLIQLSSEAASQSACCVCLNNNFKAPGIPAETRQTVSQQCSDPDGVMIASSRLTPSQLATALPGDCSRTESFGRCMTSDSMTPSEFVFLVDCSASMSSFIETVLSTLITCLKSLPEGCFFNLVPFGSGFRHLFSKSMEYTGTNVRQAMDYAYLLKAGLGGTELLPPLQWVFKNARKTDVPCQIFIITDVDQEVKDVPHILNTIRKNRHYARCHTFGVGPGICQSLVVSIAEAGRGRCVLLQEGDRLQAKVMEVLRESLSPALMDSKIHFHPPPGYSIMDSTPESLGATFSHQEKSSYALLRRNSAGPSSMLTNGFGGNNGCNDIVEPATLRGSLVGGSGEVQLPIPEASMPRLSSQQLQELMQLLTKMAQWSKLEEMEVSRLKASSRKSSKAEEDEEQTGDGGERVGEPKAKRQRLNGDRSVPPAQFPSASELKEDLVSFSLDSQLVCPFTYLRGVGQSDRVVIQLLPHQQHQNHQKLIAAATKRSRNGIVSHAKRPGDSRRHSNSHRSSSENALSPAFSMTSLSALGNSLRSFASNLFQASAPASVEFNECNTLEDEVEMQKLVSTQLSWKSHGNDRLRYPQSYYVSNTSAVAVSPSSKLSRHRVHGSKVFSGMSHVNGHSSMLTHGCTGHSGAPKMINSGPAKEVVSHLSFSNNGPLPLASTPLPLHYGRPNSATADNNSSSSSDDEDDEISDSESDSSVILASLPKSRNHSHIIQMQLFNGAWPFENKFAYATLVPLSDIKPLPLTEQESDKWLNKPKRKGSGKGDQGPDDESASHFWCTALAVVCLRDCFPEYEVEWKLVVAKGVEWIRRNLDKCGMELDDVYITAHNMFVKGNA